MAALTDGATPTSGGLNFEALAFDPDTGSAGQHGSGGQAWSTQPPLPLAPELQHLCAQLPPFSAGTTQQWNQYGSMAYGTPMYGQPPLMQTASAEPLLETPYQFCSPVPNFQASGALPPTPTAAFCQQHLPQGPSPAYDAQGFAPGYSPWMGQPHPLTQSPWSLRPPAEQPQSGGTCTCGTCTSTAGQSAATVDAALAQAKLDAAVAEVTLASERAAAAAEIERVKLVAQMAQLTDTVKALEKQQQQPGTAKLQTRHRPPVRPAAEPDVSGDAGDDSDADSDSLSVISSAYAGSMLASANVRPLPTSAVTKLTKASDGLKPESFDKFKKLFKIRCCRHHPLVRKLLAMSATSWAAVAAGRSLDGDDELRQADEWLAQQLLDCLDPDVTAVSNLIDVATEAQLDSGRALLDLCAERMRLTIGAERCVAESTFLASAPFKANMQSGEVERAALETIAKFKRLHLYNKDDPLSVRLMLIRKLGKVRQTDAIKLEEELFEAEIRASTDAAKLIEPWTEQGLVKVIAMKLASKGPVAVAALGEVKACLTCGDPSHDSKACTKRGSCNVKNCPCIYGGACIFASPKKPSNVKHALGRQVSRAVYEALLKEHKKRHPQAYATEVPPTGEPPAAPATAQPSAPPSASAAELGSAVSGSEGPTLQSHVCELDRCTSRWPQHRTRATQRAARPLARERERTAGVAHREAAHEAAARAGLAGILRHHADVLQAAILDSPFARPPRRA
jgi:hypothetical protein